MTKNISLVTKKNDILSGITVALIALPLSMGIAVASGFPAISGLITAIMGGILTGFIGGSKLTIKGPAAGMIVIVLGPVTDFRETLAPSAVMSAVYVGSNSIRHISGSHWTFKVGPLCRTHTN